MGKLKFFYCLIKFCPMELDLQVKVEDEEFSSFVSELFDHHQDICDVKFVLPRRRRRSADDEAEAVVDIVRAHNVVVCQSSVHSNLLRELFEKNKEKRDFEFCVRIQVQPSDFLAVSERFLD